MIDAGFKKFEEMSQGFKMVPVYLEIEGDLDTPITLFKKLCPSKNSYLLESVEGGNKWAQYSYIGRNPFMIIKSYGNEVIVEQEGKITSQTGSVLEIVKTLLEKYATDQIDHMPDFMGGAVGYIGYDVIRNYEDLKNINLDDMKMPDVHLLLTREIIAYDHVRQKIKIIVNVPISNDIENLYQEAMNRLQEIKKEILETKFQMREKKSENIGKTNYLRNETKEDFIRKVLQAKEYIKNGEIRQVVLSQRLQVETSINPFKAYRTLRSINPSPYMFYIDFGEYYLVGSSPELLTKVKKNAVETCPIAGSRPRGKNEEEDSLYAKELLEDKKELAEHLMLVDLSKEDISKVTKPGTLVVNPFLEIQKYSHVMHIVSNVMGEKRDDCDMYDSLMACFPAGTVSGAPKVRAMEIIDELENRKRGAYGGVVGYLGFNGNMDTCITIRTLIFKDGIAYIQAGAGIVADSNPESEYQETLRKAKALIVTIEKTEI